MLRGYGYPYIDGYKPRSNYQALLEQVVLVELGLRLGAREAVKVGEEVEVRARLLRLPRFRLPEQIIDQDFGMHFLLDVERRRLDDEVAPILVVLPSPDKLRIEVRIARIAHLFPREVLGRRNVATLVVLMREGFDLQRRLRCLALLCHFVCLCPRA